jgi:hypothetical protein
VLAQYIFIGGAFCVVPCYPTSVTRAAADWQALSVAASLATDNGASQIKDLSLKALEAKL